MNSQAVPVDSKTFRYIVGHLASGVTIVTTTSQGKNYGMTASSVTSLSLEPPMMLACLNRSAPTTAVIEAEGRFTINVLAQGQGNLAARFATPSADKFRGVEIEPGVIAGPAIVGALANIECAIDDVAVGGTHSVLFGRVVAARATPGKPLTYFRGTFGRFELETDIHVYEVLRRRITRRDLSASPTFEISEIANELDVDESSVFYAATRLEGDQLITRSFDGGYVILPFEAKTADAVFDARSALEIAALTMSEALLAESQLDSLTADFEIMKAQIARDRFVEFDTYLDANFRFHRQIVELAGNTHLLELFDRLDIREIMARSFGSTTASSHVFVDVQGELLNAIKESDSATAISAVLEYTSLAKRRAREVLESAGGSI